MDIWLAVDATNTIAPQNAAGTITGTTNSPATAFTDYLKGETEGTYTWDANGVSLTQVACP
jgi:hypothetical protein